MSGKKKAAVPGCSGKAAAFSVYGNSLESDAVSDWPTPDPDDFAHQYFHHVKLSYDVMSRDHFQCSRRNQAKPDECQQNRNRKNGCPRFEFHLYSPFIDCHFVTSYIRRFDQKSCLFS